MIIVAGVLCNGYNGMRDVVVSMFHFVYRFNAFGDIRGSRYQNAGQQTFVFNRVLLIIHCCFRHFCTQASLPSSLSGKLEVKAGSREVL